MSIIKASNRSTPGLIPDRGFSLFQIHVGKCSRAIYQIEAKAIRFAVEREKDDLRFSEVIFFTFLALFHILLAGQIEAEL
ncbi:Uncharacterised protein [Actinobacillus pleuropneumoniae]|nr:Uncharacterised protein [Actinobacillus pleuropneumoniae]